MIFLLIFLFFQDVSDVIVDSDLTFDQSIEDTKAPKDLIDSLVLLDVEYFSFDKKLHRGQIVINKSIESHIKKVFEIIKETKFPIGKVIPIVKYNWDDDKSMKDNNTSAFNYRFIAGTKRLSNHSFGRAIDINPVYNPVDYLDGRISPENGERNVKRDGTFTHDNKIVKYFKDNNFRWGGDWTTLKDWHHFDCP
jgi:peptidoglycan LD-endopeptidase CwlK